MFASRPTTWCTRSTSGDPHVPVTLGLNDKGREIRVPSNESIVLKLPENPTTGVRWSMEKTDGAIEIADDRYDLQSGAGIGAAATRVLTLKPRGRGRIELKLKRWNESAGSASVEATFDCVLVIE